MKVSFCLCSASLALGITRTATAKAMAAMMAIIFYSPGFLDCLG